MVNAYSEYRSTNSDELNFESYEFFLGLFMALGFDNVMVRSEYRMGQDSLRIDLIRVNKTIVFEFGYSLRKDMDSLNTAAAKALNEGIKRNYETKIVPPFTLLGIVGVAFFKNHISELQVIGPKSEKN